MTILSGTNLDLISYHEQSMLFCDNNIMLRKLCQAHRLKILEVEEKLNQNCTLLPSMDRGGWGYCCDTSTVNCQRKRFLLIFDVDQFHDVIPVINQLKNVSLSSELYIHSDVVDALFL